MRHAHPRSTAWPAVGRGVLAVFLTLYGVLAVFVAGAWGPGNSDEIVPGGIAVVPWFGLPIAGLLAALTSVVRLTRPHTALTAATVSAVCLIAWTLFVLSLGN
jgi:hypothetical protein